MTRRTPAPAATRTAVLAVFALWAHSAACSEVASYAEQAQQAFEQAHQALQQSQWQEAELLLERTLMLQPEHAQAMVEMAQLLAQRGRAESARALIHMLLQDPRTPAAHRQRLELLAEQMQTQAQALAAGASDSATLSTSTTGLEVAMGRSTNPLAAANVSDITLTPTSGPVSLRLSTQPQSANSLGLAAHWSKPHGYFASVQWQQVALPQASPGIRLVLQGPLLPSQPGATVHWQLHTQRYPDGSRRHQLGMGATYAQWAWLLSRYAEPESGRSGWQLRAQRALLSTPHWSSVAGAEAESGLAGASAAPGAVRANARLAYRSSAQWQLVAHWQGHADTSGYSPLLANGAARRMHTVQFHLEHNIGAEWVLRLHAARRWANIPLFGWTDAGVQLGWVASW